MSIGQALGIVVIVLMLTMLFSNGLIMLISPAWWFKLPSYVAFRGNLRECDYMKRLSGRLQIRASGLVFVGFVVYVVSRSLGISPPRFLRAIGSEVATLSFLSGRWSCTLISLAAIGCGFIMLLKPKWWVMKYMSAGGTEEGRQAILERVTQIMSVLPFAIGGFFLYHCLVGR